ncbi:hypothetical protein NLN92_00695 [Citrobacter portucalensis]|uniref:hypothetical protein n=1 Tax=Citrobacter portucalensis TaxID=1639133 RepID=UPI00226B8B4C|nr:hypothetical protein [Citrobacter portucalensis]MCX8976531.1 hypothetical protein [Citrobacter portucalensis]
MTALNKQAEAGDVSQKTYYIHPAAFGGTKDPDHGHVPVVKADDFEKLRAKQEAAEKRNAELTEFIQHIKKCLVKNGEYAPLSHEVIDTLLGIRADGIRAAGIGVKGE